jgi:hypothetical protein
MGVSSNTSKQRAEQLRESSRETAKAMIADVNLF